MYFIILLLVGTYPQAQQRVFCIKPVRSQFTQPVSFVPLLSLRICVRM